jgi:Transglycosylase SLT domain
VTRKVFGRIGMGKSERTAGNLLGEEVGSNETCSNARGLRGALVLASLLLGLTLLQQAPARAEPQNAGTSDQLKATGQAKRANLYASTICRVVSQAAADNGLPLEFFTRLIWQESRFNPDAVSPKGAQGIAQFMPGTASWRGLADPFEPEQALRESASYLRELRTTFRGSLGLAAAAYNAGPGRVEAWLAGRGGLPAETRAYVRTVTGHDADTWASPSPPQWEPAAVPKGGNCIEVAKLITAAPRPSRVALAESPAWAPWGVQLAGNWSEGGVLATYERLRRTYNPVLRDRLPLVLRAKLPGKRGAAKFIVRISESTRMKADALCAQLRAAGGACIVLRNPPA